MVVQNGSQQGATPLLYVHSYLYMWTVLSVGKPNVKRVETYIIVFMDFMSSFYRYKKIINEGKFYMSAL